MGSALGGALLALAPAVAEETYLKVGQRIDAAFEVVLSNVPELAVPLTKRALARRSIEADAAADESEEPRFTAAVPIAPSPDAEADSAEEGSADPEDPDVARLPRPRPTTDGQNTSAPAVEETASLIGTPLDLVAGAALIVPVSEEPAPIEAPLVVAAATDAGTVLDTPATAPETATPTPAPSDSVPAYAAELVASGACLAVDDVNDKDGDFEGNAEALKSGGFCIAEEKFRERRRHWTIHTVATGRPGPLFVVMHDDENLSFDTAVAALKTHGGTLVAVETGGKRNQDGIDPNRNFSADGIGCSKLGKDAAPRFTGAFARLFDPAQPIVALHNNTGKRISTGGLGHVSMDAVPKKMARHPSDDPGGPLAGDRALVLLTSLKDVTTTSDALAESLNAMGINAVLERVEEGKGDCSLSNHALLTDHSSFFNITVDDDEGEKQTKLINAVLGALNPTVASQ